MRYLPQKSLKLLVCLSVVFYFIGKLRTGNSNTKGHRVSKLQRPLLSFQDTNGILSESDVNSKPLDRILKGNTPTSAGWIKIQANNINLYIYKIFWDNREGVEVGPVLRVLGILTSSSRYKSLREQPSFEAVCYIKCAGDSTVHQVPYKGEDTNQIYIPRVNEGLPYFRYVLVCDLHAAPCKRPEWASLQAAEPPYHFEAPTKLTGGDAIIVEYPHIYLPGQRLEFGVCGPVVYHQVDIYRLVEWLELMKILGVSKVVLYQYNISIAAYRVLQSYQYQGLVDLREIYQEIFPTKDYGDPNLIYTLGPIALTDCMYRTMFQFVWTIVVDLDEMIIPTLPINYHQLFKRLGLEQPIQNSVGYKFIHSDFILDPTFDPQPDEDIPWQMALMKYRRRYVNTKTTFHPKSIINPRLCTAMHYHVCRGTLPNVRKARLVNTSLALDCHFRSRLCPTEMSPSLEECRKELLANDRVVDDRTLAYRSKVQSGMRKQLDVLGLRQIRIPVNSIL